MQIILFWFGLFPVTFVNCVWIIKCLRANVQSQQVPTRYDDRSKLAYKVGLFAPGLLIV